MMDRADIVHQNFLHRVQRGEFPLRKSQITLDQAGLAPQDLVQLFYSQTQSRQLDRTSRKLQARGQGFYTIGSSGHEGNTALAAALRLSDMTFLHYRDAAFQIERSKQLPGQTPVWDMLLSFATSTEDPISGGRHKVLGSKALFIPPQTSTIASHLPKAVGAAYSIGLADRLHPEHRQLPDDAIVMCSFGDASLNHSTAQGAFNTAGWTAFQKVPLPLMFVCEDNGIGISTKTPKGWIEASMGSRPGLAYFQCDGLDVIETYSVARKAAQFVRQHRAPAFLHVSCVRLYGHAGADVQTSYLSKQEIEAEEADDPLLHTARSLIEAGVFDASGVIDLYTRVGACVERAAEEVITRPRLHTSKEVMASIIPPRRENRPTNGPSAKHRREVFGTNDLAAMNTPQHMAKLLNMALSDLMLEHDEIVVAGEDVGRKGGVYGVTQKLQQRFGADRVIDTLLDEQSILGLAIGLGHNGLIPIPEVQFLAYLHNAEDQLRGEAATLSFFSQGQYTNPMVLRIAGLGYQRGFGGHFHNDNSIAVLRDIPGIIIACPSNGEDGVHMLRECIRLAREEQRIVVFLEPIALYMTKDLHEPGDRLWSHAYPQPGQGTPIAVGEIGQTGEGTDLAIVTFGNGNLLSQQAGKILKDDYGIAARIIDLRWIAPLAKEAILQATHPCRTVLIVDECRRTGGQSEALIALFAHRDPGNVACLAGEDSFIATGPAYAATMPSREGIIAAALKLAGHKSAHQTPAGRA